MNSPSRSPYSLLQVMCQCRYVSLTVDLPETSQPTSRPYQSVQGREHSLHSRSPSEHLPLIGLAAVTLSCSHEDRMVHAKSYVSTLLASRQTLGLHRTLLAVAVASNVLMDSVSPAEAIAAQLLALRTYQVVSSILEATRVEHVLLMIGMDRNVSGHVHIFETLPLGGQRCMRCLPPDSQA